MHGDYNRKKYTPADIPELNVETCEVLTKYPESPEVFNGVTVIPPRTGKTGGILFLASCAYEEEIETKNSKSPPMYMKGPAGSVLARLASNAGIDMDDHSYVAVVPHALNRKFKLKPPGSYLALYRDVLHEYIRELKPSLIVVLGAIAFKAVYHVRMKYTQIVGCAFFSDEFGCNIYCADDTYGLISKPEKVEKFFVDLREVASIYHSVRYGVSRVGELNYRYITKLKDLSDLVDDIIANPQYRIMSVDCEWGGLNYVDGLLRYFQFCWEKGEACCVMFRKAGMEWIFDAPQEEINAVLGRLFNRPDVFFIGHNISADSVWMKHHLGIDIYRRAIFDTMFAQHTVDEYADLKLERLAVQFTDFGRYDVDLIVYKKMNPSNDEGYENIPDEILAPYSLKDVDTVMRAWPILQSRLKEDGSDRYFYTIKLPFATDGFSDMIETGVPCSIELLREMSTQYVFVRNLMNEVFISMISDEAFNLFLNSIREYIPQDKLTPDFVTSCVKNKKDTGTHEFVESHIKSSVQDLEKRKHLLDIYKHYLNVDSFSHTSVPDMIRWLFDVKKYKPLYTTKKDGISISWEKVEKMGPAERKNYSPSTDKGTLKYYAERGDTCLEYLGQLKSVSTIVRTFLREDSGGLKKFVSSKGFVHTNFGLTETNRPRTYKPNILNIPSYVAKNIEKAAIAALDFYERMCKQHGKDVFDKRYEETYGDKPLDVSFLRENLRPVRFNFECKTGACMVGADYKTAEIVALAYISGDQNMIRAVSEPDLQFGLIGESVEKSKPVRIAFNQNSGISAGNQSVDVVPADDPRLLRDEDGELVHPRRDLHWEFVECETFKDTPRELLDKDKDRSQGKIGNFSIPYGGRESYLETKIEVETGVKPPEGTGKKIIDTYSAKYPDADRFLLDRELDPERGRFQSVSGAVRHYHVFEKGSIEGLSDFVRNKSLSALQREARNIPIQGIVADSLARATVWCNDMFRKEGMSSRVIIPLYDALYIYCPEMKERFRALEILQVCMADRNIWKIEDRILKFELDPDMYINWSCKPTKEQKQMLYDRTVNV